jgi:hypothetical protein
VADGIGRTAGLLTNTNAIRDYQKQTSPTEGVLQQTTPMAYATQTKTSRRKSMSPKQFGLSPTHPAKLSMEKALQNLGPKIALSATLGEDALKHVRQSAIHKTAHTR